MLERDYQAALIKRIKRKFPGSVVLKNDTSYIQGIPDLTVLFNERWGVLEAKRSANEEPRPNQEYYVDLLDQMSFGSFIHPENEEEVLDELQRSWELRW
jgi:hypothetical protein